MKPNTEQLVRLVSIADDVDDLDTRVAHQFGQEYVDSARLVAVQMNGARWVFGTVTESLSGFTKVWRVIQRPSGLVLSATCLLAIWALLYLPYIFTAQEVSIHMGFFSIFPELAPNRNQGAINVQLLSIEMLVIAAVGAVCYLLALRVEHH